MMDKHIVQIVRPNKAFNPETIAYFQYFADSNYFIPEIIDGFNEIRNAHDNTL